MKPVSSAEPVISCRDLRTQYKGSGEVVYAVNGLDLEIQSGECFGLLGPNGAGRTTAIEIFEGLLPPTSCRFSDLFPSLELACWWPAGRGNWKRSQD